MLQPRPEVKNLLNKIHISELRNSKSEEARGPVNFKNATSQRPEYTEVSWLLLSA
jgi:hypothetical protein